MKKIFTYLESNKQQFMEELLEFCVTPLMSSISGSTPYMSSAAEYWMKALIRAGADKAVIFPTSGNPVVYAEKIIDSKKPTILLYGHSGVMSVDSVNQWNSTPFDTEIRDGKIFTHDVNVKIGQVFIQIKAFECMFKTGTLPCNVKFVIEGEEKIGSPCLEEFCSVYKNMLKADVILIVDSCMLAPNIPSIAVGLYELLSLEVGVEVTRPNQDLYAELYERAEVNPIIILSEMIACLYDENDPITIPGFSDIVREPLVQKYAEMCNTPCNIDTSRYALNITVVCGENGFISAERASIDHSLDISGLWRDFTGEEDKSATPSKVCAKLLVQLASNQDHKQIARFFEDHFLRIVPHWVKVKVTNLHGGQDEGMPTCTKAYNAAIIACESTFGKKSLPVINNCSIPIVLLFKRVLGINPVICGLESDVAHSSDGNFSLFDLCRGVETVSYFCKYYCE